MIHPIQTAVVNRDGSVVFCVIKNMIQVFRWDQTKSEFVAAGQWVDDEDSSNAIKKKVSEEQQRQRAENEAKRRKIEDDAAESETAKRSRRHKDAKVPVPGAGAPPVYNHVRNLALSRDEKLLYACTDSDKALVVFALDFDKENCLILQKRQPLPKRPNALTTTQDDKQVLVADKFGDVYSVDARGSDVVDVSKGNLEPILGHVSLLTAVAIVCDADGKQLLVTADRDEHIRLTHYPQTYIVDKWLFGSKQFVSTLCVPEWGTNLLFSAGGDNFVSSWNWQSGELVDALDIDELVNPFLGDAQLAPSKFQDESNSLVEYAVSKLVTFSNLPYVAFFVEQTRALFICKVDPLVGKLMLVQTIEMSLNIVSLSSALSADSIMVTLDHRDSENAHLAAFITWDGTQFSVDGEKNISFHNCITEKLHEDPVASTEAQDIYPLYSVATLRKRAEN
ncbi:LAME_0G11716g1_1 [Lachancea meyersii CBS 8951]|uniref:LAME_0G11716g1_1 n=1 Tax=Lachancea meyersii CBS 8951 TaxID=1266667 RepID=A0A1G4K9G2_9SACH|nr:LAME_0G11716g1_1 [Lachancea meyersii CBS 8951]